MDWRAENWPQPSCMQPQRHFSPERLDDGSCASCSKWFFLFRTAIHIRIPTSLWFQQFVESIYILLDCMHSSITRLVDYFCHVKQSGHYVCAQCICYGLWWNNRNVAGEISFYSFMIEFTGSASDDHERRLCILSVHLHIEIAPNRHIHVT